MEIKHKFSFTPKSKIIKDLFQQNLVKNNQQINPVNIVQLEEPKEESFHFLSPRKSTKIQLEEEDDIYKTEMNNKTPLELFQEITNDIPENNKKLEFEQKMTINNYDCDNNIMDKSNMSGSFSNIIQNQIYSNDKNDETNNSTVRYNTMNITEDSKNNFDNKSSNKLLKFCQSMMNWKKVAKIHDKYDLFINSKKITIKKIQKANNKERIYNNDEFINNYKDLENYNTHSHISYLRDLNNKKSCSQFTNIKTKLIKRTPKNEKFNNIYKELNDIFSEENKQKNKNVNSRISFDNSLSFCNKKNPKINSAFNTSRGYTMINKNQISQNTNNIKSFSFSKFIYKKRIIKKNNTHIQDDEICKKEENKNNENFLRNTKSFRKEKEMINTFRLNIKPIKRKEMKNESKIESKKEIPINLKNKNFYSSIYESLLNKQKENFKNNIIIQNFNNYNLNTYNSNRNINPNFINFDNYKNNEHEKINKTNVGIKSKRKNIILEIKINKRCFSKNEKRNKKFIL